MTPTPKKRITKIPLWARVPTPLARFARVTAFVVVVAAAVVGIVGYRARAQLTERMIDAGTAMLAYEGAHRQDTRRTLLFNGQEIHFSSGMTRHHLDRVLDFYEAHCLAHDGGVAEEVTAFIDEHDEEVRFTRPSVFDPILRSEHGNRGTVGCLYTEERGGTAGFMERYRRYQETGDVAEIGDMRYLYAEESDNGTHFVVMWTEGPFVLRRMLPESGDAPGHDVAGIGRPDGMRRFASLREEGAPQAMTVYRASEDGPSRAALGAFYRRDLERRGWRLLDTGAREDDARDVLAAELDERMVTLILATDDENRSVVTLLEAR